MKTHFIADKFIMQRRYFFPAILIIGLILIFTVHVHHEVSVSDKPSTPSHPIADDTPQVLCLDPGHPSETNSGATRQHGTTEVEINWQVTQKLAKALRQRGYRVVLTKTACDESVVNRRRAAIANEADAVLFLRLHCDTGSGSGYTFYYPDRPGTIDGHTGPTTGIIAASKDAALAIHRAMRGTLPLRDNGCKGESATFVGHTQGALTGSIYAQIPAVTIEMVFLSNSTDAEFIKSETGQQQMANALATAVIAYLQHRHDLHEKDVSNATPQG